MKHVVVIGGGIIGLSSAFYLQQSGCKVTVIDKDNFEDNCSYGNAGYVCPSHFIPLAAPGIIWQGFKWMFNPKSPFYVKPSLNKALIDWGFNFAKSATQKNVIKSAIPLCDISLLSQHEFEQWAKIPGFEFGYEHKGMLEVFQTEAVAKHAHHTIEKAHELGLDVSLLNYDDLQLLEPQTKINAIGALQFKCDAHVYPDKLMKVLKEHLLAQGVTFQYGETVVSFEKENGAVTKVITDKQSYLADELVIAAGAWSKEMAELVDAKISLMPGRGYSLTLEDSIYKVNHPMILAEGRVAITPMDGNKIRFGGTMEVVPTTAKPQYHRIEGVLRAVKDFLPEFDIQKPLEENIWYGYRPCSADGLPYIGKIKKYNNVVVATGHSMMGLSLGPGTGKLVSQLINREPTSIDIKAFEVERFN
ncbi:glycine/D-amino acid oxidase-like deaminating enzyme [Flavobacterium sp. 1]|uniref:NAD(P)/FAD-dependent oxidoreductase n=1 Tax=Flavobacterium sp. 1 TaxID=2035200 RepID=UPI000C23C93B|nr:FAD-dependent oxidoreductase [Flavobacterium sp. 1]PJJ07771.1 glycine/D-amino acid oxidase-like deaminating enzyme [Flavobacterium sp. 1]